MSQVFECDLPTTEKFVLLTMADYASDSGESIFPSVETLARKTSLSDRSVQNSIQSLISKGYLTLSSKGGGRNHTNRYKILCTKFTHCVKGETGTVKGETGTVKGETGTVKGEPPAPDPSLTIKEPSLTTSENIVIPDSLNTPEFISKWGEWIIFRRELGKKITPSTQRAQFKKLSAYSVSVAIATIDQSITAGWQGLFPIKNDDIGAKYGI
jgi:biotin operon repressor